MKKVFVTVLSITIFLTFISCRPSVVTNAEIETKISYASDQAAISGIFEDIYNIPQIYIDYNNIEKIANPLTSAFFTEEKEIGEWLKLKYGLNIKKGEMIKIIYTYNNDKDGFDIIYKPYNRDIFKKDTISGYDFLTILGNKEPVNTNTNSSYKTLNSNNPLANTKWQSVDDSLIISFGLNSYTLEDKRGLVATSTYKVTGDAVNLSIGTQILTGSLIGDTLSISLKGKFKRIE